MAHTIFVIVVCVAGNMLLHLFIQGTEAIGYAQLRMVITLPLSFVNGLLLLNAAALKTINHSATNSVVVFLCVTIPRVLWSLATLRWHKSLGFLYLVYPLFACIATVVSFVVYIILRHRISKSKPLCRES